jgi:quinol monooxygenase YgiN
MLIVIASFDMDPEDRQRFVDSRKDQAVQARDAPGCIDYAFSLDAFNSSRVRLVEIWRDQADLTAQLATRPTTSDQSVRVVKREVTLYDAAVAPTAGT